MQNKTPTVCFGTALLAEEKAYLWALLTANELQRQNQLSITSLHHKQKKRILSFLQKEGVHKDENGKADLIKTTGCEFEFVLPEITYNFRHDPSNRSPTTFKQNRTTLLNHNMTWLRVHSGFDTDLPYNQLDFLILLLHNMLHSTKSSAIISFPWFGIEDSSPKCLGCCTISASTISRFDTIN